MVIQLRLFRGMLLGWCFVGCAIDLDAATFQEPRLTQVIKEVRVTAANPSPAPASTNDLLPDGILQTGPDSRAEITCKDRTIFRLGDKTTLALHSAGRIVDLSSGAILAQVPRGVGGTQVRIAHTSATATGTTLLVEYLPEAYTKFIVLDGTSRIALNMPGHFSDHVLLRTGQMLIVGPKAKMLPEAADVDLQRLLTTCQLVTDFPRLPELELLTKAALKQSRSKRHGGFADTNLVIFGRGTLVSKDDAKVANPKAARMAANSPPKASPDPTPEP